MVPATSPDAATTAGRVPTADAEAMLSDDAGMGPILWRWTGTYEFHECDRAFSAARCWRYRIAIADCPGACSARLDVDGPGTRRRLTAVGTGTSNRYELALRSRGTRDGDQDGAPVEDDAILVRLEFLPGGHLLLRFERLTSPLGTPHIVVVGHAARGRSP
jgi:hypothetical protein